MGDMGQIKSLMIMDKAFHNSRYPNSKFTPENLKLIRHQRNEKEKKDIVQHTQLDCMQTDQQSGGQQVEAMQC